MTNIPQGARMIGYRIWFWAVCLAVLTSLRASLADEPGFQPFQDIIFISEHDGSEQRYVLGLPANFDPAEKHDVMIALHGHGSDRWQFVQTTRDECLAARKVAAKHQMVYVSPDYRAKTSWMGPAAEADVVQIIGIMQEQHPGARIFICGASMGGTSALAFAALHPELIVGAASLNGAANLLEYKGFPEAISESYGGTKAMVPEVYKARSAEYWPERLTFPVAMTTGANDKLVPPDSCLRLAEVLKLMERKVLLIHREEGGHSTNLEDSMAAIEFIIEHAAKSAETSK